MTEIQCDLVLLSWNHLEETKPCLESLFRTTDVPSRLLIVDNAIWSGRSLDETDQSDQSIAIREFIAKVKSSPDWDGMIVPIRDGRMVARRS